MGKHSRRPVIDPEDQGEVNALIENTLYEAAKFYGPFADPTDIAGLVQQRLEEAGRLIYKEV
jgi:hypothetical protein